MDNYNNNIKIAIGWCLRFYTIMLSLIYSVQSMINRKSKNRLESININIEKQELIFIWYMANCETYRWKDYVNKISKII